MSTPKQQKIQKRHEDILTILIRSESAAISEIVASISNLHPKSSKITITRDLNELIEKGLVKREGRAKATKYKLTVGYKILAPVDLAKYFSKPQDDRTIIEQFNFKIFGVLRESAVLNNSEIKTLQTLQQKYQTNIQKLSQTIREREIERVTIELSWKSSAIEGNTYSLLETETLLKDGREARGKKKEEAIMLLNHKRAFDFVFKNSGGFETLDISKIEQVHRLLTQNMNIPRNIRKTLVGITGTNYKPLDNQHQITEALEKTCLLLNSMNNTFAKSLISILLISYIQPFEDGNKRTARIIGNAILLANDAFPLSFRSVGETEYKEALLVFYEINNVDPFKQLYLQQTEFAVENYFRTGRD